MNRQSSLPTENLCQVIDRGLQALQSLREHWDLESEVDLELANHAIRVFLQAQLWPQALEQLSKLAGVQMRDGAWPMRSRTAVPSVRATGFSVQMLYRGQERKIGTFSGAIAAGLDFLTGLQAADGSWDDNRWGRMDATSMVLGTLIMLSADPAYTQKLRDPLQRAMDFAIRSRTTLGIWQKKPGRDCVETTAHYVQKLIPFGADAASLEPSIRYVLGEQGTDGAWLEEVDATCDATRALLLSAVRRPEILPDEVWAAVERGMHWLLEHFTPEGIGSVPGARPNALHTADAVDTFLKFVHGKRDGRELLAAYLPVG